MSAIHCSLLCCLLVVLVSCAPPLLPSSSLTQGSTVSCSFEEHSAMPCPCCKKDCWYTIAAAATHELGHMPGEAGEQEAMATLRLIRACMMAECSGVCIARRPF